MMSVRLSRISALLAFGLGWVRPAFAQVSSANALGLLDAYLAQAARADPDYRADIVIGGAALTSPGRFPGYSSFLGPFDYRPKTYNELTRSDRAALLRDPAFHAFLGAVRPPEESPAGAGPDSPAPARRRQFSVTPAEMLAARTVLVVIPPP
jgi:hypothetical protein